MHKDKCDNCGSTESSTFWDFEDKSVLCNECYPELKDKWEKRKKSHFDFITWLLFFSAISFMTGSYIGIIPGIIISLVVWRIDIFYHIIFPYKFVTKSTEKIEQKSASDACYDCGKTNATLYFDQPDGTVLCDKCFKKKKLK